MSIRLPFQRENSSPSGSRIPLELQTDGKMLQHTVNIAHTLAYDLFEQSKRFCRRLQLLL